MARFIAPNQPHQSIALSDHFSGQKNDGRNDFMRRVREHGEEFVAVDREHLEGSKIRIGTRLWIIERILANKYGPKPQVVVNNQQNVVSIDPTEAAQIYQKT